MDIGWEAREAAIKIHRMSNDYNKQTMLSIYCVCFMYFDMHGSRKLCQYILACSGANWEDVPYPIKITMGGFFLGHNFFCDAPAGGFDCNMGNFPVLQGTILQKTKVYTTD